MHTGIFMMDISWTKGLCVRDEWTHSSFFSFLCTNICLWKIKFLPHLSAFMFRLNEIQFHSMQLRISRALISGRLLFIITLCVIKIIYSIIRHSFPFNYLIYLFRFPVFFSKYSISLHSFCLWIFIVNMLKKYTHFKCNVCRAVLCHSSYSMFVMSLCSAVRLICFVCPKMI